MIEIVWTFEEDGKWQNFKNDTGVECLGHKGKGEALEQRMDGIRRANAHTEKDVENCGRLK